MIDNLEYKWESASISPALKEGEVHLWKVELDRDPAVISLLYDLLSDDEQQRADRYVFARDRQHFIAGRASLRKIIGGYLGIAPERVGFSTLRFGKPFLEADDGGLRFNVSHSNGIAAIAVSLNREVGVDIEFVDRNFDVAGVAPNVFSSAEVSRISSLPVDLQAETFFSGWTRKEAFLKAMGDGLSSSEELQNAVSVLNEEDASFRSVENNKIADWSLTSFKIHDDFKAALVVQGEIGTLRYWNMVEDQVSNFLPHLRPVASAEKSINLRKPVEVEFEAVSNLCVE